MARKSVTKDMNGNIINLIDETDGGYIVRARQIVNPEKWNKLVEAEQARRDSAKAMTEAVAAPPEIVALRNQTGVTVETLAKVQSGEKVPDKVDQLEQRMNEQNDKLNAILKALQK
jgi:hypothetical protein